MLKMYVFCKVKCWNIAFLCFFTCNFMLSIFSCQKHPVLLPLTKLEMSWSLVKNSRIHCHKHGRKMSHTSHQKQSGFVVTKKAENVNTSHQTYLFLFATCLVNNLQFVPTDVAGNVLTSLQKYLVFCLKQNWKCLGVFPKYWVLLPETKLENVWVSRQKYLDLLPQTMLNYVVTSHQKHQVSLPEPQLDIDPQILSKISVFCHHMSCQQHPVCSHWCSWKCPDILSKILDVVATKMAGIFPNISSKISGFAAWSRTGNVPVSCQTIGCSYLKQSWKMSQQKYPVLLPEAQLEMHRHRVENIWFCRHKKGWKCSNVWPKISGFITWKTDWDCLRIPT